MACTKGYRWCFVPLCKNTSKSAPSKIFVFVPSDDKKRKLWFEMVRRSDKPTKSNYFCCQDHFNLKEDMENYVRFSLMGGPIKMKSDVVPHIFDCQPNRKRSTSDSSRPTSEKRRRRADVADLLAIPGCLSFSDAAKENVPLNIMTESSNLDINDIPIAAESISQPNVKIINNSEETHKHRGVQVNMPRSHNVRSKSVSCNLKVSTRDAVCSPMKIKKVDAINSPIKVPGQLQQSSGDTISTVVSMLAPTTSSDWEPLFAEEKEFEKNKREGMQTGALLVTNYFISTHSKNYIGVPSECNWILDLLHIHTKIRTDDIKLTLMKIKLDDTFKRLGEQFGMSTSQASKIFNSSVPKLAHMLKTLIYFPSKESIKKALPIPFRANYCHVQSIIDCFEIQIEKPSNSLHQALTWSEYKKANTLKYLISSTPDGFINYISSGFGGRITDTLITEICGFLDVLPKNCGVMADRGFKQIQVLLNKKKCTLIRPPSVSANVKPTKAEVLETKRIASLRIHIERVIGRLREYKMLVPHACLSHNSLSAIDSVVIIAAALINIQSPIIKT